eukprot:CAMPEP_0201647826 /NCGR_PEP_ID=MMETSP0493-20130528/36488_1 /ASSEMBLY_ACC=CAM_ASM_000838 /TAXON_ID=420259 /ORGANISM="Thalassiosira gravida, Strain GMp14c1" /LENGTH=64 /DNA_ID=CAMNT_0048123319 /DNA_START=46 /DNA_END=237 /DNA_ORIENTATION=-
MPPRTESTTPKPATIQQSTFKYAGAKENKKKMDPCFLHPADEVKIDFTSLGQGRRVDICVRKQQ